MCDGVAVGVVVFAVGELVGVELVEDDAGVGVVGVEEDDTAVGGPRHVGLPVFVFAPAGQFVRFGTELACVLRACFQVVLVLKLEVRVQLIFH